MKTDYANAETIIATAKTNSAANNPANIASSDIEAAETALENATTTTAIANAQALIKSFDAVTFDTDISETVLAGNTISNAASATSGRTLTYTSSNSSVISVSGSTLTAVAAGTATITATTGSTGDGYYQCTNTRTFTVVRNANTLTVIGNQDMKVDGTKAGVYSNKNSTASVQYEIANVVYTNESQNSGTGVISYDPATNAITALNAGSATLRIYQDQNGAYEGVNKTLNVNVTKYDQSLSWKTEDFTLLPTEVLDAAESNRGLPVTYTTSDASVISVTEEPGKIKGISDGKAIITASQAGNYKYNAATNIEETFTVAKKQATFTPGWWDGNEKPSTTYLKVGGTTTIRLTNIGATKPTQDGEGTFFVTASPAGVISWSRSDDGKTLTITAVAAGEDDADAEATLTLTDDGTATVNGANAQYTFKVSKYANNLAVAAETKAMQVGNGWTGVVTAETGNGNPIQVTYAPEGSESIAVYDAADNKITALSEGSTNIIFTQAATATHKSATRTIAVKVTKVPNTLAFTLPAQDVEVDGTINLVIDTESQNNPSDITAEITEEVFSSDVYEGAHVITFANNAITACNAGTAKIKFIQAATDTYADFESDVYDITVSKIRNAITLTLDNEVRNSKNVARGDNIVLKYSSVSNGAYTVALTSGSTATATLGNNTVVDGVNTRTITAGSTDGTNIWTISQAETYKYEPATTTVRIKVNSIAEDPGYVYKHDEEISWGTYGSTGALELDGPGEFFTFDAKRTPILGVTDNLGYKAQYSADGSNWTSFDLELADRNTWYPCSFPGNNQPIPEDIAYVQILSEFPAGGNHQVKNILVTRKTFIRANDVNGTNLGETYVDATPYLTKKFTVRYSTTNGGDIEIISNNPRFEVSPSKIAVAYNSDNVGEGDTPVEITVTYKPNKVGYEFAGSDAATITISDLFNSAELTFTATSKKRNVTIARGENTETTTTVDGVIDKVFSITGTSAIPSDDNTKDLYYVINHSPATVNNGNGVISYNPVTNTITGLNGGTATLTIYQKSTSVYNATSQSFTFTVNKLENNVGIALSTTELDVDGTATVTLTNPVSDGALSASWTTPQYTNEDQNRDGGLLSFANGTLTAVNAGTATVTITQAETYKYVPKSASFSIKVNKLTQTLTWDDPNLETGMQVGSTLEGNTAKSDVGLTPVTYESGNTKAITVDPSTGLLTAEETGSNIVITARQAGNYKYLPASISRTFSVFNKSVPVFTPDAHFTTGTNGEVDGRVEQTCTATITVTGVGADSEEGFTITNGDNTIIDVVRDDETITITGLAEGSTTLTLTQSGNDAYLAKTQTYNITVFWPDDFLTLTPGTAPDYDDEVDYRKIFLQRTLKAGYSTIALPFATNVATLTGRANAEDWVAQLKTVTHTQVDAGTNDEYTLYFHKVDGGAIAANQPYVLHLGTPVVNPTWTNMVDGISVAAIPEVPAASSQTLTGYSGCSTEWGMYANYDPAFSMDGKYGIVNAQGGLMLGSGSDAILRAFTAYIIGPAPTTPNLAPRLRVAYVDTDGTTTVVEGFYPDTHDSQGEPVAIYGPDGQRRSRLQRGVNIVRYSDGGVKRVQY